MELVIPFVASSWFCQSFSQRYTPKKWTLFHYCPRSSLPIWLRQSDLLKATPLTPLGRGCNQVCRDKWSTFLNCSPWRFSRLLGSSRQSLLWLQRLWQHFYQMKRFCTPLLWSFSRTTTIESVPLAKPYRCSKRMGHWCYLFFSAGYCWWLLSEQRQKDQE